MTTYPIEFDIHEMLAKEKKIAIIWSIEDVQEIRPDLNEDEAWEVLKRVHKQLDASMGVTWETLEFAAQSIFGDAPESR